MERAGPKIFSQHGDVGFILLAELNSREDIVPARNLGIESSGLRQHLPAGQFSKDHGHGGRADIDFEGQVRLDLNYIRSASLHNDIVILLKTVPAVLFGKGAY